MTIQAERGEDYKAFSLFGTTHLAELAVCVLVIVLVSLWYRHSGEKTRRRILVGLTILLLADELLKYVAMLFTGQWSPKYLPLHLCSINLFVCVLHTWKGWSWCREMLYSLCLPGAVLALLLPSWQAAPVWNVMHLHSASVHALLILYPVLLVVGGFRPEPRKLPRTLAILYGACIPIYFVNKALDTNFFFLNDPYCNFLTTAFTGLLGEKLYFLAFLPLSVLIVGLMVLPWAAIARKKNRPVSRQ